MLGLMFNILKSHPKALLLLIRKRKCFEVNKLKSESKFLSNKRNRDELQEKESSAEEKEQEIFLQENDKNNKTSHKEKNILKNLEILEKELTLNDKADEDTEKMICKYDRFLDEELDPYNTNAQNSCLWELYSLRNHYNYKIRSLVNKFERNFLKSKEFDIASISSIKDEDLLYDISDKANFYINSITNVNDIKANVSAKLDELL